MGKLPKVNKPLVYTHADCDVLIVVTFVTSVRGSVT